MLVTGDEQTNAKTFSQKVSKKYLYPTELLNQKSKILNIRQINCLNIFVYLQKNINETLSETS